jgi:hypothetical protein
MSFKYLVWMLVWVLVLRWILEIAGGQQCCGPQTISPRGSVCRHPHPGSKGISWLRYWFWNGRRQCSIYNMWHPYAKRAAKHVSAANHGFLADNEVFSIRGKMSSQATEGLQQQQDTHRQQGSTVGQIVHEVESNLYYEYI